MQPKNEKRTAPKGAAQINDYYFELAVMLTRRGSLSGNLLASEDSGNCNNSSYLGTTKWQERCDRSNSDFN